MNDFKWTNFAIEGDNRSNYERTCGIMSISNMAYPQWHPVPCKERIMVDIICTDQWQNSSSYKDTTTSTDKKVSTKNVCAENFILYQNYCYMFSDVAIKNKKRIQNSYKFITNAQNIQLLVSISKVSKADVKFITVSHENEMTQKVLQYNTFLNTFTTKTRAIQKLKRNEFFITKVFKTDTFYVNQRSTILLDCSGGEFISKVYLHEEVWNCSHESNDRICFKDGKGMDLSYCKTSCVKPGCICDDFYYHKQDGGCSPYLKLSIETFSINFITSVKSFNIPGTNLALVDTKNIMLSLKDIHENYDQYKQNKPHSFYLDCDKNEFSRIKTNKTAFIKSCENPDEFLCTYGCRKCFATHKLCTYELDYDGRLMHCPSGAHLKNCELIGCNNMFKCTNSYCVPYRYFSNNSLSKQV